MASSLNLLVQYIQSRSRETVLGWGAGKMSLCRVWSRGEGSTRPTPTSSEDYIRIARDFVGEVIVVLLGEENVVMHDQMPDLNAEVKKRDRRLHLVPHLNGYAYVFRYFDGRVALDQQPFNLAMIVRDVYYHLMLDKLSVLLEEMGVEAQDIREIRGDVIARAIPTVESFFPRKSSAPAILPIEKDHIRNIQRILEARGIEKFSYDTLREAFPPLPAALLKFLYSFGRPLPEVLQVEQQLILLANFADGTLQLHRIRSDINQRDASAGSGQSPEALYFVPPWKGSIQVACEFCNTHNSYGLQPKQDVVKLVCLGCGASPRLDQIDI